MSHAIGATRRPEQLLGVVLVVVSAVAFGSGPFFATVAYDQQMAAMPILFWRFLAAAAVSWAIVLVAPWGRASLRALTRRRLAILVGLGVLYVGNSFTYVAALRTVDVSLAAMIVYLYPALVAVLSVRFGRRLEGRRAWVALALSTAGVMLAVGGVPADAMPPVIGLLLAVASPIIYSGWIILSARTAGERRRPAGPTRATIPPADAEGPTAAGARRSAPPAAAVASTLMISGTAAGCAAWLVATGGPIAPTTVPAGAWPALIAFGACSAVAIQAFYAGVKRIGGARASLISTVEPVYTIALATVILGEVLTPIQLAGGALVIAGVLLAESGSGRPRRRPTVTAASA